MDSDNNISFTTNQVETLWTELAQAWPAVKNNPDIAEKIEKLWDILKTAGHDHPAINQEIQNLHDSNSSAFITSNTNPIIEATTATLNTAIQAEDELDNLLAEILGENYQEELNHPTSQVDNNQNISNFPSIRSGKEELDKLVAPILGKDWLKDGSETTSTPSSFSSSKNKIDDNIDSLVSSIIDDDIDEASSKSSPPQYISENIDDKQDIDELLNDIMSDDDLNVQFKSHKIKAEENIDDLINEILNQGTASVNTNNEIDETQPIYKEPKENIDELINEVLNIDSNDTDTTSSLNNYDEHKEIISSQNTEENIDVLINEILKDKVASKSSESDEFKIEEINITDKVNNIPPKKTETQKTKSKDVSQPESTSYKQPEKESSNSFIIILLIIIILISVATWWFFMKNKEPALENKPTTTSPVTTIHKDESTVDSEKPSPVLQKEVKPKPEYKAAKIKPVLSNEKTDYSGHIEENKNDITIILNSPETAIDTKSDSIIFNETKAVTTEVIEPLTDDKKTESIPETSQPIKTLKEKELIIKQAKKVKPKKAVTKRKVIIHKIIKGDTLWAIAKRYVNNPYRYPELAKLSKIKNPNRIYPGNKVRIIIYTK